jgi:hypothetical protein
MFSDKRERKRTIVPRQNDKREGAEKF